MSEQSFRESAGYLAGCFEPKNEYELQIKAEVLEGVGNDPLEERVMRSLRSHEEDVRDDEPELEDTEVRRLTKELMLEELTAEIHAILDRKHWEQQDAINKAFYDG
jgi:hypothetical protein